MITDKLQVIASLCKGCGVCAGICPCDAITMERDVRGLYIPNIDIVKCSRCMLCVRSCPATLRFPIEEVPIRQLSDKDVIGPCLEAYAGYSVDESLRYKAASGGIVTALLLSAFEREAIDAALVVMPSRADAFESCAEIIKDGQAIFKSVGSRYLPVEYSKALKQLAQDNSIKSASIVGLPCHIDGIKRACLEVPKLHNKIAFTIALFCKQMKDLQFTDMILAKIRVRKEDVKEIKFRGEGWPGLIQVELKNGNIVRYPYEEFASLWGTFSCTPMCCLLCTTPMGEVSDISVGDAWLDKFRSNRIGVSAVLVRTKVGADIVGQAFRDKRIYVESLNPSVVVDMQPRFVIMVKKANFTHRLRILSLFDPKVANLCTDVQLSAKSLLRSLEFLWILGIRCITSSVLFRRFYHLFPSTMLRILSCGAFAISKILSKSGAQ